MELAFLASVVLDSDILISSYATDAMFKSYRREFVILSELSAKAKIDPSDFSRMLGAGIDAKLLATMSETVASAANWEYYQTGIFQHWAEEQIKSAYKLALAQGYPDCIDVVERVMTAVALRQTKAATHHVRDVMAPALERITQRVRARGKIPGVSWGFSQIDQCTLGAQAGQLVVVGARPSQGKSAIMAQMARRMAKDGVTVGVGRCGRRGRRSVSPRMQVRTRKVLSFCTRKCWVVFRKPCRIPIPRSN
jgi:replicative DNA helicase